jgi:hypothetical protein
LSNQAEGEGIVLHLFLHEFLDQCYQFFLVFKGKLIWVDKGVQFSPRALKATIHEALDLLPM